MIQNYNTLPITRNLLLGNNRQLIFRGHRISNLYITTQLPAGAKAHKARHIVQAGPEKPSKLKHCIGKTQGM